MTSTLFQDPIGLSRDMSQMWKDSPSRSVGESFEKFADPDPAADHFFLVTSTATSLVKVT